MTSPVASIHDRPLGWQMWVPCIGMALCSWLSFVDRQVLAILTPTIMQDTGLTPQHFTDAASFFFLAYTLGNPVWGSAIDFMGLRFGMLLAVAVWTGGQHVARDDVVVPRLRARPRSAGAGRRRDLPWRLAHRGGDAAAHLRARGIALSFSGGTIGAVMMPLLLGPLAIKYGWRAAFLTTGALGAIWLLIWAAIARPPFLPASPPKPSKLTWPNFRERRVWALVFSYALPAISPGPVLTILSLYLTGRLGLTQVDVNQLAWIPPLTWGIGYFFWGWAADRYAANNARPVGLFLLLTVASLTLGAATWTTSVAGGDGADLVLDLHRRRVPDGGAEGRLLRIPPRAGRHDVRHRLGLVVARQLRAAARDRRLVRLDERRAVGGDLLADRAAARRWSRHLAGAEPESGAGAGTRARQGLRGVTRRRT